MFSDTHCHIRYLEKRGIDTAAVVRGIALSRMPFVLDAGIEADDLPRRIALVDGLCTRAEEERNGESGCEAVCAAQARSVFRFGAGIWPDQHAVENRTEQVETLKAHLAACTDARVCAIGECGFDRHRLPDDEVDEKGERELFDMQLELARTKAFPVIVHSRDAFEQTIAALRDNPDCTGVIHCYSYGIEEARTFLDAGWYISLAGSVTYAKKTQRDETERLVRFIPSDRLLLETDAPYLAPVPLRGKPNTPLFVEHTYRFVSAVRSVGIEELAQTVLQNARTLFG